MKESEIKILVKSKAQEIIDNYTTLVGRKCRAEKEYTIANDIKVDYALLDDKTGEILALIECKKGDSIDPTGKRTGRLGVHDLMTGIGQVEQYIFQMENNLFDASSAKRIADGAKAFLATDANVKSGLIEWDKLKYPKGFNLLLFENTSKTHECYELYKKNVLNKFAQKRNKQVRTNAYFSKESCIWECYIALKALDMEARKNNHNVRIDRGRVLAPIFNNVRYKGKHSDIKNIGIALSTLGFINDNNQPTREGLDMIEGTYYDYLKYVTYYKYIDQFSIVLTAMVEIGADNLQSIHQISCAQKDIKKKVQNMYQGRDVVYVTNDNATRYIGSWFAMLRDELGAIEEIVISRKKFYNIRYFPYKELDAMGNLEKYAPIPSQVSNFLLDNGLPGI